MILFLDSSQGFLRVQMAGDHPAILKKEKTLGTRLS